MDTNSELLGRYQGRFYTITRKVSPSFQHIEEFSITVHFTDPETMKEIEVVRIDNAHGTVHMDCLFEEGTPKNPMPEMDAFSAYDYLKDNWKRFARQFHRT